MKVNLVGRHCRSLAGVVIGFGVLTGGSPTALAQPANDLCSAAEALQLDVIITGTNEMATSDVAASSCSFLDELDVWYSFTVPPGGAARYHFEAIPDFTTTLPQPALSAYDACGGAEVACAIDGGWQLDLDLVDNQTVYLRVAGAEHGVGTFLMLATLAPPPAVNDECGGAIPLTLDESFVDIVEATVSGGGACMPDARDAWYTFTAPDADRFRFRVRGDLANVAVYEGCGGTELACDSDCYANGDAAVDLAAGQTVQVRVGGCGPSTSFLFFITADRAPTAPANDHCGNAQPLTPGTVTLGTTRGATHLDEPEVSCFSPFPPTDIFGVWYSLTNPAAAPRLFHLTATPINSDGFLPIVTVLSGCNGAMLACGGENGGPNQATSLNTMLAAGETVLIRVAGDLYIEGDFELSVSAPLEPAANDECATAIALNPALSVAGTTASATESFFLFLGCANGDIIDAWYSLTNTAASAQIFEIDTLGTSMTNPTLAAFDGCDGALLDCGLTEFGDDGAAARVAFIVNAGQTVLVRIAGTDRSVGDFVLNVSEPSTPPPPPANDDCSTATVVDFPYAEVVAAGAAAPDTLHSCLDVQLSTSGGVWYRFTPNQEGVVRITQNGFVPELAYALFEGGCISLTEVACQGFSPAAFPVQAGVDYLLLVGRQRAESASPYDVYDIQIDLLTIPDWGDACADAVDITLPIRGLINIDAALNEGIGDAPAGSCNGLDTMTVGMNNSAYLTFVAGESGDLRASFAPMFFEAVAVLYEGTCGSLTELACTSGLEETALSARVQAGQRYTLQIGSYDLFWFGSDVAFSMEITPPSCAADLDGGGAVDVFDLLAYLDLWFAGDAAAELTGDEPAAIDVFDLLVYLDAWFAGCD